MVPKWEELNMDCLVNILGRVDMENLLLDVPYVCKSWYIATFNPQCWSTLNFVNNYYGSYYQKPSRDKFELWDMPARLTEEYRINTGVSAGRFIEYVVKRGNGLTTFVKLPSSWNREALIYISEECPNLRTLKLPSDLVEYDLMNLVPLLVSKWPRLESMTLSSDFNLCAILAQISVHCKNFGTLEVFNAGQIGKEEASALVTFVPELQSLSLGNADIDKDSLLKILNGCKKLEYLDVRDCVGFVKNDDDLLNSAAHIHTLKIEGLTPDERNEESCSYYDESFDDDSCWIYN